MFTKAVTKILLSAGLLMILVLSASSISKAQSSVSSQADVDHPNHEECSDLHPCDPHATPEPLTMLLFGTGLLGVAAATRRRLRRD